MVGWLVGLFACLSSVCLLLVDLAWGVASCYFGCMFVIGVCVVYVGVTT